MARLPDLRRVLRSRALPWAVALVAAALAGVFALLWRSEVTEDRRRAEVEAAASAFLRALTNFSAETIEEDVERIRGFAVGRFADELEQTFSPERVEAIREQNAVSTGRVRDVFVQEIGEDTATAFGVVAETVANDQTDTPRQDTLRVELGMIETADEWKVERLTLLQTPATPPPA